MCECFACEQRLDHNVKRYYVADTEVNILHASASKKPKRQLRSRSLDETSTSTYRRCERPQYPYKKGAAGIDTTTSYGLGENSILTSLLATTNSFYLHQSGKY